MKLDFEKAFDLIEHSAILQIFQQAIGLKVNFAKSCLVPINVDIFHATVLADFFDCSIGKMPFTYLGLPLGTTKPTVLDLAPLADSVERRLNACSRFYIMV